MFKEKAESFDQLSHTFSKDMEFCQALAAMQPKRLAHLFVYVRWSQNYVQHIQNELYEISKHHFDPEMVDNARLWTLLLAGSLLRDISLVSYLAIRGLIWDAGYAIRRGLENVGVLSHFWNDPRLAEFLTSPDHQDYKKAFIRESNSNLANGLKSKGIYKRFSTCLMAKPISDLYNILSKYSVHGGSVEQFSAIEVNPTRLSCLLVNRADPLEKDFGKDLEILANGCEMLCIELVHVHGKFAKQYGFLPSKGGEGGHLLTSLLDKSPDGELVHLIEANISDFGW